ncbi:arginase family protein [Tetragenococcus koreensis]|uniref:arginase family protein n=1 Tax=Tetragenococcus koreensis TaxID=290335 RepID=UPI001F19F86F|nr:arginase family protein [Tetragenococcus koreensis]MDN6507875.1 arginase family protein [Tetragenococcus halophilus]MDN6730068.1 arginase family protein [Alkalibacterium sp.]MCF1585252.1 arginase family protein [Tetragenococcus koreensis]MCF1614237.1 arginase family protein [Tetragenococcus koreensis]MCF1618392.1 arginase family protein [Tetragenococcus koreensis]
MTTLRLRMPQWQGSNNFNYYFGGKALEWLAPKSETAETIEVPISTKQDVTTEDGINSRSVVTSQINAAKDILTKEKPEKVIVFGGDCLVSQAPVDYMSQKYGDKLGVVWIDAHPDVSNKTIQPNSHSMVLGNLYGNGDDQLAALVKNPIKPEQVGFIGLNEPNDFETEQLENYRFTDIRDKDTTTIIRKINRWIEEQGFEAIYIHFDLDVLDPEYFRNNLFANPYGDPVDAPHGLLQIQQVGEIISSIEKQTPLVGLAITEHLPWDAINLYNALDQIQLFHD